MRAIVGELGVNDNTPNGPDGRGTSGAAPVRRLPRAHSDRSIRLSIGGQLPAT